jgi:hypothetical protein
MPAPRALLALALGTAALLATLPARAEFTADDAARLARGEMVTEESDYVRGYDQFVGGVSYLIVPQRWERLSETARDVKKLPVVLPYVKSIKLLRVAPSGRATVRVEHQFGIMPAGYTVVYEFKDGGRFGRFWLDPTADNSLHDAWGFVRLTPIGDGSRTLVTVGILFDLGAGLFRNLFESRIKHLVLALPRRLANATN